MKNIGKVDIFNFVQPNSLLINPVNVFGVSGAGLALEFRKRYPEYFLEYKETCKNVFDVMKAQSDLVDIVHTLRAVVCVKG
jgi:hypothetical protein